MLVGEMRDLATISAAITAAETGHLVFGTLHTSGAASTINRIIDAFPTDQQEQIRVQLANNLIAVLSQALCPRVDVEGMVAAYEFMYVTPGIQNLIRENKVFRIDSEIQTGKKFGMQLLDDNLWNLFQAGKISKEEAIDKSKNPNLMAERFLAPAWTSASWRGAGRRRLDAVAQAARRVRAPPAGGSSAPPKPTARPRSPRTGRECSGQKNSVQQECSNQCRRETNRPRRVAPAAASAAPPAPRPPGGAQARQRPGDAANGQARRPAASLPSINSRAAHRPRPDQDGQGHPRAGRRGPDFQKQKGGRSAAS
jgi:hypothetical protein